MVISHYPQPLRLTLMVAHQGLRHRRRAKLHANNYELALSYPFPTKKGTTKLKG